MIGPIICSNKQAGSRYALSLARAKRCNSIPRAGTEVIGPIICSNRQAGSRYVLSLARAKRYNSIPNKWEGK